MHEDVLVSLDALEAPAREDERLAANARAIVTCARSRAPSSSREDRTPAGKCGRISSMGWTPTDRLVVR